MRDILVKYPLTLLRTHLNNIRRSYANDLKGISKMKKSDVIDHLIKYNFDVNKLPPMKHLGKTRLTKEEKNLANVLSSALKNKRAKQNLEGMKLMKQSQQPQQPQAKPMLEPTPETKAKETLASAIRTRKAKQEFKKEINLKELNKSNFTTEKERTFLEEIKKLPLVDNRYNSKDRAFSIKKAKLLFKILRKFDKIEKDILDKKELNIDREKLNIKKTILKDDLKKMINPNVYYWIVNNYDINDYINDFIIGTFARFKNDEYKKKVSDIINKYI